MKLYATVSSERASKGQGGKTLSVNVTNSERETIFFIELDGTKPFPVIKNIGGYDSIIQQIKTLLVCECSYCKTRANEVIEPWDIDPEDNKIKNKNVCRFSGETEPCEVCPKDGVGNCETLQDIATSNNPQTYHNDDNNWK